MSATSEPTRRSGAVPAQGLLFDDDLPELREDEGYRGPTACRAAGITYRQVDPAPIHTWTCRPAG